MTESAPTLSVSPWRLLLAGAPRVQRPDGAIESIGERDAALLAWLALEGPTQRGRVAQLFWPDSGGESARSSLRQRLFKLRRQLGVDVVAGTAVLALSEWVEHDLVAGGGVLGQIELSFGLEFDAWLARHRAGHAGRRRDALVEAVLAAEQRRDYADALRPAVDLLTIEPSVEEAHRRVMRLHALNGDPSAALLAFDRCERMLKQEFGARPSGETLALLETIEQALSTTRVPTEAQRLRLPVSVVRPARMIGRDAELTRLAEALASRRATVIGGEGGLGKSRLIAEFVARRGGRILVSSARPGDEGVVYASAARLLRQLPRGVVAALDDETRRELSSLLPELGSTRAPSGDARLVGAVVAAIDAASPAFDAIVVDDLHFVDDASAELLRGVAVATRCRWLLASRLAEGGAGARAWLDALLVHDDTAAIVLQPLTVQQFAELVDSLGIDELRGQVPAPALHRHTGGNPLFLLETIKAWLVQDESARSASLPIAGSVLAQVQRRITQLSRPAIELIRCAAVAAPDFSIQLATHVLRVRPLALADAWAELEAAQLLRDSDFAHDLIHEAALASVPVAVGRELHAEVAQYLSLHDAPPARLAWHWERADRWPEAGRAFEAAALHALAAARRFEQAELLGDAARCFDAAGMPDEQFEAALLRAQTLAGDEMGPRAIDALDELQRLARTPEQKLRTYEPRLELMIVIDDPAELHRVGLEALDAARALDSPELTVSFGISVAGALSNLRRAPEAVALLDSNRDWIRDHPGHRLVPEFWFAMAFSLDYAGRLSDSVSAASKAIRVAEAAGRGDLVWKSLACQAATFGKLGLVADSARQCISALQIAIDGGLEDSRRIFQTEVICAHRLRDLGRYGEALPLLDRAIKGFRDFDLESDHATTCHRLAQAYQQLGQPGRAMSLIDVPRRGLNPGQQTMQLVHVADLAHDLGRDGLATMREALTIIDNPDDVYHRIAQMFATRLVPPDEGEAMATSLAAWASARNRLGVALAGHVRAARCALALGAARRALPHLEAALHLAIDRIPDSFYLPELWWIGARVQDALGNAVEADRLQAVGAAWVQRVVEQHVPAEFRDSFLLRNPVNRALLTSRQPG